MNAEFQIEPEDPELMASIGIIESLAERNKQRQEDFKKRIAEAPPEKCPEHGTLRRADERHSLMLNQIVYQRCSTCVQIEADARHRAYGIPENLLHARWEDWQPSEQDSISHMETVRTFATECKCGFLLLLGKYGTGKSHLAAVAAMAKGTSFMFITQADLLRQLRESYDGGKNPIPRAKAAELLVLDELGASGGGKDEFPMIHEILCHRYSKKLPTIITSNLTMDELMPFVGSRVADRFDECAYASLTFNGKSRRSEARNNYFKK